MAQEGGSMGIGAQDGAQEAAEEEKEAGGALGLA